MRRALYLAPALCATAMLAVPAVASAHGLVGKQDLPIPRWLFAWAATAVLVVSFIGLAVLWPRPRLQSVRERLLVRLPRVVDVLCGAVGVAVFVFLVYAGLAGAQQARDNILPTVIYVLFWVGIPCVSLLLGDVFRAFNPWRAVGRLSGWLAARVARDSLPEPLPYPERLGRWPAALGIFAFVWVELGYVNRDDPGTLAILALAYAVVQLIGMSVYGVAPWSDRADAFGVYFGLFARLSPLHWHRSRLLGRPVLGGAPQLAPMAGTVALLCVMIGTTSFDGFSLGGLWTPIGGRLQDAVVALGFSRAVGLEFAIAVGLLAAVGVIAALYWLGIDGVRSATGGDRGELAQAFVHTLIPISLAYVVAHYFGLLSYQGQAIAYLISDPLGTGEDIFGTADSAIDYTWISATAIWYIQIGALLLGHVSGLILAHDRAIARWPDPRTAMRSQYWMLGVMVCFTCLALWLLSGSA
jgi:hypothetical protein